MKAKYLQFATIIAKAITVDMIQGKIVEEFSEYFVLNETDGRLHPTAAASLKHAAVAAVTNTAALRTLMRWTCVSLC